jgi:hypothetical protein
MRRLTRTLAITSTLFYAGAASAQDEEDDTETIETEGEAEEVPVPEEGGGGGGDTDAPGLVGGYTAKTYPRSYVDRPTTLGKGMIEIQGEAGVGLSKDFAGQPIGLHPDVYYGVNDDLTLGLTHAQGICFNGEIEDTGFDLCGSGPYDDVGIDALYKVHRKGKLDLAAHGGLDIPAFDPFTMSLRAGVSGEYLAMPELGIFFDPYITFGITERDGDATMGVAGNKETINVPVWAAYQVTPELAPWLRTGIAGPLDGFGDAWVMPLAVGALYSLGQQMDVGGEFVFPAIASGVEDGPGADLRELQLFFNYRM